jgi:hypothetical protein
MKVRYTAIYKIRGASRLAVEAERVEFLALRDPLVSATLTTNPEPNFLHIDKSAALAAQLLKGLFSPDREGTPQERLAAETEFVRVRRANQTSGGLFLVFDGEAQIPTPEFRAYRDAGEFAVAMDAMSKPEIRERFRPFVQSVLAALGLSLPENADRRVEKSGEVVYLVDPDTQKPIYNFTVEGGFARGSIASPLTLDAIAEAAALAPKLASHKAVARPTSLLVASLNEATDDLQAFIAAWSALEIFVNATFKATYENRWFEIMEGGAPASAKPVFERLKGIMNDKYRPTDKFLVIASVLDAIMASDDATEFGRLKKIRDGLLHALDTPSSPLPTDAVQKLLLKYMKLHLDSQQ